MIYVTDERRLSRRCMWRSPYCGTGIVVAMLAVVAVLGYVDVGVALDECSGDVEDSELCSNPRPCDIGSNPSCLTNIRVSYESMCTNGENGDNCLDTENTDECGARYDCDLNEEETECITGNKLGDLLYYLPTDGGTCIPE